MNARTLPAAILGGLLLSGCVVDARRADTIIGPERVVETALEPGDRLKIRIPVGDIDIRGVPGDRLRAEMIVRCPDEASRCARRLADVALITQADGDTLILRTSQNSARQFREGNIRTIIEVPALAALDVDVTAGDLNITDVSACVNVDMGAGDVDVTIPVERVRDVRIDAGIGNASLRIDDRRRSAPRSLLVGAELDWHEGPGDCEVAVDLQVGDISVELVGDPG